MELYRPQDVATAVGISGSTVRQWAIKLKPFLSTSANPKQGHRRFTAQDVARFQQVKTLLETGYTWEQLPGLLESEPLPPDYTTVEDDTNEFENDIEQPRAIVPAINALAANTVAQLQQTGSDISDLRRRLDALADMVADLRERVARVEANTHDHPGIVPTRRNKPLD